MKTSIQYAIIWFIAGLAAGAPALAQQPRQAAAGGPVCLLKGVVIDAKKQSPLEFANIVLKRIPDSSLAGAAYSGKTGEFILSNIAPGKYTMRISFVGYETKLLRDIEIAPGEREQALGNIALEETAIQLNDVNVQAERPSEEFRLDKKVINVSQSMQSTGGTALDVLRNQSSIQVDASETVTLRGSSMFTVLINGKPSVFAGSDALRQIPANIIDNIEIITNPSAKYDAEGAAGIININLKKQASKTTSAIVNLTSGTRDKYSGDITVNHAIESGIITGGVDYSSRSYFQVQDVDRLTMSSTGDIITNTDLDRRDIHDQLNLRLGMDYTIDERNQFSISGSGGKVLSFKDFELDVHNQSSVGNSYLNTVNRFELDAEYFTSILSYKYSFIPDASALSLEATHTYVNLPYWQRTTEYQTDPRFGTRLANPLTKMMDTKNHRNEGRVKLEYRRTFSEQNAFECGVQSNFSYRVFDVQNTQLEWGPDQWVIDPELTNKYDFRNNVYAAYAMYSDALLDFEYQLGLRSEYTDRLLKQRTMGNDYAYDVLDFFPTLNISRKLGEHTFQFSFSRRIDRPNEWLLNPFPFYSDTYLQSAGNPKLLPEYINAYELNYQKMFGTVFLSVQTYYRNARNTATQFESVDDNGRHYITYQNWAKAEAEGAEITVSIPAAMWLRLDPNVNLYNYRIDGATVDNSLHSEAFIWTARLNSTFLISPDTRVQITANYVGKQREPQQSTDPLFYLSVSARQDFFNKMFALTLQGHNLLKTSYYNISSHGSNFRNTFEVRPEVPMVSLTLTYNFNNFRRVGNRPENVDVNVGG